MFDLTGKTALLTGASKGMGLAMAQALAQQGAKVVISARGQDQLDAAAAQINQELGEKRVFGVACNVGHKEQLAQLVDRTRALCGPVDVVFGNAGVNPYFGPTADIPDDAYTKTMATNVQSNLWLARLVAPDMIAAGGGSMAFTSSIAAFKPSTELGTYGVSKLALIGLVRNLAAELGPHGIRCNAICPGLVKTDFAKELWSDPKTQDRITKAIPLRRLGHPEDFAGIAVFLASNASRYMTGQALTLCGGSSMWS